METALRHILSVAYNNLSCKCFNNISSDDDDVPPTPLNPPPLCDPPCSESRSRRSISPNIFCIASVSLLPTSRLYDDDFIDVRAFPLYGRCDGDGGTTAADDDDDDDDDDDEAAGNNDCDVNEGKLFKLPIEPFI